MLFVGNEEADLLVSSKLTRDPSNDVGRNRRMALGLNRRIHRGGQVRLLDDASYITIRETCRSQHALKLDLLTNGGIVEACHDGSLPFLDRRRLTR